VLHDVIVVGEPDPLPGGVGLVLVGAATQRSRREGRDHIAAVQPPGRASVHRNDLAAADREVVGQPRIQRVDGNDLRGGEPACRADPQDRRLLAIEDVDLPGFHVHASQPVAGVDAARVPAVKYEPPAVLGEVQVVVQVLGQGTVGKLTLG